MAITCFPFRVGIGPRLKCFFIGFLPVNHPKALKPFILADEVFPVIGNLRIPGCIFDAQFIAAVHAFLDNVQYACAGFDAGRVGHLLSQFNSEGTQIALCTARKTHDHGEVAFFDPFEAYRKILAGFVGNIFFRKGGR